jgi:hypothetical protein
VDFERGAGTARGLLSETLRAALEAADVECIAKNSGGAGVRLRKGGE